MRLISQLGQPRRVRGGGGGSSVGLICGQQGGLYRLHTGGAGEGAHEPAVDAVQVVGVEAGQEANGISTLKLHHADHTPGGETEKSIQTHTIVMLCFSDW